MAAPTIVTRLQAGLCHSFLWKRSLHSTTLLCAGQEWRIKHGFARSGSEYGPLTDLPDWSFADGRPAPQWKGQIRRKEENKEFAVSDFSVYRVVNRLLLSKPLFNLT
ncbi:hypothetical protein GDO81_001762 [Engystomops pustulosus]|uniref:Large ribosomal subunit protein mL52 n=1 Tax=Engystomops pustulosus TaxID=76066 RepID=A0AAV7DGR4_ENGPU|nr:hypothetical protein GDO81_001762 [Engystomops pustulosus]